jgi:DNA-binding CsgD family transcriptional regulator
VDPFLSTHNLTYFSYQRFCEDGTHLSLFSSLSWCDLYLEKINEDSPAFIQNAQNLDPSGFNPRFWPKTRDDPVVNALYGHNLWNGICLYKKCPEGLEAWEFAATKEQESVLNFYVTNIPLMTQFIEYLRPRLNKYVYPQDTKVYTHFNNLSDSKHRSVWLSDNTPIQCYSHKGLISLSPQESKCVRGLKKGLSSKEIAFHMELKQKTVEEYLGNVKKKLGFYKTTQVLSFLFGQMP